MDIREITIGHVRALCARFHGYAGAGNTAVYAFGVFEQGRIVAAYAWQPPPPGAARSVCPAAPHGVLALSRMVAVPRAERELRHVSKPLRAQMRRLIDRTRWPALVTFSDEGQGHTGHVYKCSGWTPTRRTRTPILTDADGRRVSSYSAGKHRSAEGFTRGYTWIQRWEHHAPLAPLLDGWRREIIPGLVWRSGAPAARWVRAQEQAPPAAPADAPA